MAEQTRTGHEAAAGESHHHGRYHPHVVPLWLLAAIFVALLLLTYITVAVAQYDFGMMNLPVALLIAAVKASLVGLFFMHLLWDSPFNGVVLIGAFLFLSLMLWFTVVDTGEYSPQQQPISEREGFVEPGG